MIHIRSKYILMVQGLGENHEFINYVLFFQKIIQLRILIQKSLNYYCFSYKSLIYFLVKTKIFKLN